MPALSNAVLLSPQQKITMDGAIISVLCFILATGYVSGEVGYFWHVTDFHYDPTYNASSASCIGNRVWDSLGPFGDTSCDSPWRLIASSVQAMKSIKPDVDFLLWTGDTVMHADVDKLNHTLNAVMLDNTTDLLKSTFPGIPVYASFGNHDSYPQDQFPPANTALYNESLARWRDWISDTSQEVNFKKGGYYTVKTSYNIRIIVLNTILYYTRNNQVGQDGDPAGQFVWLTELLQKAKREKEKVLITAHISPGIDRTDIMQLNAQHNDRLVAILRKFADIVVAMHFGHEHSDAFKVLRNEAGDPAVPVFIAPSVTPIQYDGMHNPGVRLVKYDRSNGKHIAISQYDLDLYAANEAKAAKWRLEYDTSRIYNLPYLTAETLYGLMEDMKNPISKEFQNYWKFYYVSPPTEFLQECDMNCHAVIVCGFTEFVRIDFDACFTAMVSSVAAVTNWSFVIMLSLLWLCRA